jgi:hypothetical protein
MAEPLMGSPVVSLQVWRKALGDGSVAFVAFNRGEAPMPVRLRGPTHELAPSSMLYVRTGTHVRVYGLVKSLGLNARSHSRKGCCA